jgi:predicted AlkP superfamily pyrophosphatase or phosphodiesterase
LLGYFVEQINQEFKGKVNVVIVSYHGMTKVNKDHVIKWQENIIEGVKAINGGTQLYLYSDDEIKLQQSVQLFIDTQTENKQAQYRVYQYLNFPAHWHLNRKTAVVPNVIIEALPSYVFSQGKANIKVETHGYDPMSFQDLEAIFIATGPAFSKKKQIAAFENIHVLPIITRALGLKDVDNIDGSYQVAEQVVTQIVK